MAEVKLQVVISGGLAKASVFDLCSSVQTLLSQPFSIVYYLILINFFSIQTYSDDKNTGFIKQRWRTRPGIEWKKNYNGWKSQIVRYMGVIKHAIKQ